MPTVAQQEDDLDDPGSDSEDDLSTISDPAWQDSIAFAIAHPAIKLQLNAVNLSIEVSTDGLPMAYRPQCRGD